MNLLMHGRRILVLAVMLMLAGCGNGPDDRFPDHRAVVIGIDGADWKLIIRGNLSHVVFDLGNDYCEQTELDGSKSPIAQRYLRTLHGQFLGAPDRGRWLAASSGPAGKKKPTLDEEKQEMTPELCRQLVALGYISAECDELLSN